MDRIDREKILKLPENAIRFIYPVSCSNGSFCDSFPVPALPVQDFQSVLARLWN
jgi:hypothetical protein